MPLKPYSAEKYVDERDQVEDLQELRGKEVSRTPAE